MAGQPAEHGLDRLLRAEGLAQRTQAQGLASLSTTGCLRSGAASRRGTSEIGVLRAGGLAQAALHAVLLDEAQLRRVLVVLQRARRAGADAGQAQRAVVLVDRDGAEGRARQAAGCASGAAGAAFSAGACVHQVVERESRACCACRRRRRSGPPARARCWRRVAQAGERAVERVRRWPPRPARSACRRSPGPCSSACAIVHLLPQRGEVRAAPRRRWTAPRPATRRRRWRSSHRSMPVLATCISATGITLAGTPCARPSCACTPEFADQRLAGFLAVQQQRRIAAARACVGGQQRAQLAAPGRARAGRCSPARRSGTPWCRRRSRRRGSG